MMGNFKFLFLLLIIIACKPYDYSLRADCMRDELTMWREPHPYTYLNERWLNDQKDFDSTCSSVKFKVVQDFYFVWKDTIRSNGFFAVKYGDFAFDGYLRKGVPVGEWRYMSLKTFVSVSEVFKCGYSYIIGNGIGYIAAKDFGASFGYDYDKQEKYRNTCDEHKRVMRFRRKVHEELFDRQIKAYKLFGHHRENR